MLTDYEVEKILRDDLQRTRECVQQSLNSLLRCTDVVGSGRERFNQQFAHHSTVCAQALLALRRWNRFCVSGKIPGDLTGRAKAAGSA
jgi:hypothetical protein